MLGRAGLCAQSNHRLVLVLRAFLSLHGGWEEEGTGRGAGTHLKRGRCLPSRGWGLPEPVSRWAGFGPTLWKCSTHTHTHTPRSRKLEFSPLRLHFHLPRGLKCAGRDKKIIQGTEEGRGQLVPRKVVNILLLKVRKMVNLHSKNDATGGLRSELVTKV